MKYSRRILCGVSVGLLLLAIMILVVWPLSQEPEEPTTSTTREESLVKDPEGEADTDDTVTNTLPDHTVIYATVFTHNEDGLGPLDPNYTQDEAEFWKDREVLIDFATMLKRRGVAYDFQTDWNFLLAVKAFDQGTASSAGKNVIQYLSEDLGAQVDAHSHQSLGYNMADVAYLISTLGVTPSNIVGGMIAAPPEESLLEDYWQPIRANKFDYTWEAKAIWGGGTGLHQNEEALWTSGVWRPKNKTAYLVHDEDGLIPVIGHYRATWEGLDHLLARYEAGALVAEEMYTIALDAHQRDMDETFVQEFEEHLENYQEEIDQGILVWATLNEVLETWQTTYQEEPNIFSYLTEGETLDDTIDQNRCGDGTCQLLERQRSVCPEDCL